MPTLYGIKNCDTVKKARRWLEQQQVDYRFHDFRSDGLTLSQVNTWIAQLGWETLVNKRSTTWKQLDENTRAGLSDSSAAAVIAANPTLIKRPLLDLNKRYHVGFKEADYRQLFG